MRAREPDRTGYVDRDGVRVAYESFGEGDDDGDVPARWTRSWTARCGRRRCPSCPGTTGWSPSTRAATVARTGRPSPAAYDDLEFIGDAIAVLDELGIEKAVLVGRLLLAPGSRSPTRPGTPTGCRAWSRSRRTSSTARRRSPVRADGGWRGSRRSCRRTTGWDKMNRQHWLARLAGLRRVLLRPDLLRAALHQGAARTPSASPSAPSGAVMVRRRRRAALVRRDARGGGEACCESVPCPVLVIEGTEDRCQPRGRFDTVARLTGAERVVLDGAGHLPMAREPVAVNRAIKAFVDRITGTDPPPSPPSTRRSRAPRVLYLSSPIGLGHVRRDLAVARALREERPDVEVEWLTQSPVAEFLVQAGETLHPASRAPGQRVDALRVRVRRARPARVPGGPPDGRGAGQQLHGLRRPGLPGVLRPVGRATRPGTSTTSCTRTPASSGRRSCG